MKTTTTNPYHLSCARIGAYIKLAQYSEVWILQKDLKWHMISGDHGTEGYGPISPDHIESYAQTMGGTVEFRP